MMNEKEQTKWLNVLNEADIDDVITINGLCIKVIENTDRGSGCEECAFYRANNEQHYCGLNEGAGVTPCIPFNNSLGKSLRFILFDDI